jgi:hypothetical protein
MIFSDEDAGKDCCGGDRVWVVFHNVSFYHAEGLTDAEAEKLIEEEHPGIIRDWAWDWRKDIKNLPTTQQTDMFDQPGIPGGGPGKFEIAGTLLIGIACRSKKDTLLFNNKLIDAGTVLYDVTWDGAKEQAKVAVDPNLQYSNQDVQNDLLKDGKWIAKMGGGAKGTDDKFK